MHRSSWFSFLGFGVGITLCVWLMLWQGVTWAAMRAALAGVSWPWCLLVLGLTALLMLTGERKWRLLAQSWPGAEGEAPEASFFRRHYLWQNWFGQFVPPSLAIIGGRGLAAHRWRKNYPGSHGVRAGLLNGLFDQGLDFLFLCAFLPGAMLNFFGLRWDWFFLGTVIGLGLVLLVLYLGRPFLPSSLRAICGPAAAWSWARAVLTLVRLLVGVKALGFSLSLVAVAALSPVTAFVALIPLTPGNLGLAEVSWWGGLVLLGQNDQEAALYAFGFRVLVLVAQTALLGLNELYVFCRSSLR